MGKRYGYGVDLSELDFNDEEAMRHFIKKYLPDQAENMEEDEEEDEIDVFEWIDDYENDFGYHGLSAMLVDIINEHEGIELAAYDDIPNGCIYIPDQQPWQFNEKEKTLTPDSIQEIFEKYLNQITEDRIQCEDLSLYVDSLD